MFISELSSKGWNIITLIGLSLLESRVGGQSPLDPWVMCKGNISWEKSMEETDASWTPNHTDHRSYLHKMQGENHQLGKTEH